MLLGESAQHCLNRFRPSRLLKTKRVCENSSYTIFPRPLLWKYPKRVVVTRGLKAVTGTAFRPYGNEVLREGNHLGLLFRLQGQD
jgi:hypothetical protein